MTTGEQPVKILSGLLLAMPIEAYGLGEWKGWKREGGYTSRSQVLGRDRDLLWVISGRGGDQALRAGRWLVSQGVSSLTVLGLSGGLHPLLRPGDMVVADSLFEEKGGKVTPCWKSDSPTLVRAQALLKGKGLRCHRGALVTSREPVMSETKRRELFARTRALAVDMESSAVARAAAEAGGLPLFILRAVCDGPGDFLPEEIYGCLDGVGAVHLTRLFRAIGKKPSLLPVVCSLARDFILAIYALRRAWLLQTGTGLPYSSSEAHRPSWR